MYSTYSTHPPPNLPAAASYSVYAPPPATSVSSTVSRKRKQPTRAKSTSKRTQQHAAPAGVGPSAAPIPSPHQANAPEPQATSVPATHTTIRSNTGEANGGRITGAADCWALLVGATYERDPGGEAKELVKNRALNHLKAAPGTLRRPSKSEFPRLLCVPCMRTKNAWHTWSNTDGGSTVGPRKHMKTEHAHAYLVSCHRIGYKLEDSDGAFAYENINEDITETGLARYMAEFVAEQDLAFNIVQAPSFRRLLCYVGQNNITPDMIPERRVVAQAVSDLTEEAKKRLAKSMQSAEGRISITSDLWTDEMDRPFMAATAHYATKQTSDEKEELTVNLIAFRFVDSSHTGENLGKILFGILSEYGILHKIGSITLDNASNNDKMMEYLQRYLNKEGHKFSKDGNRICCFPHVINLAVNDVLDDLSSAATKYLAKQLNDGHTPGPTTTAYINALKSGLVKRIRETIEGNEKGWWKEYEDQMVNERHEDGSEVEVTRRVLVIVAKKPLELILNCRTRWSSTRNMIKRYIYLYPAIEQYISQNRTILGQYSITLQEFKVLNDIAAVLDISHEAQELLSAEQTPTLSLAFPVYDQLICRWKEASNKYPALCSAIDAGIQKIEKYINKSRTSEIHILAMFLNPSVKYTYIDKHWTHEEQENARVVVMKYLTEYAEARENDARLASTSSSAHALSNKASSSLGRGLANMFHDNNMGYQCTLDDMGVTPPRYRPISSAGLPNPVPPDTPIRRPASASINLGLTSSSTNECRLLAELEHNRYLGSPDPNKFEDLGRIDLVKYWSIQRMLPLLQLISKDVLPAQASSVSSERIFLSSKLTCTRARNKISVQTVEKLQILKHSIRYRRKATTKPDPEADFENSADVGQTSDIMMELGHTDWTHDAITDFDSTA
ncbi:hAT family dimerization protein [Ceratobasidium sp. AG-Ba]|nr:hAT family dimerization protein [Ceratobasidium sp. AG-Ba]